MNIDQAIDIMWQAHKHQKDLAGKPYIEHLIRVSMSLDTEQERCLGLLHDLVEDTDWTFMRLAEHLTEEELFILDCLTHIPNEPWTQYIFRVMRHPVAIKIKLADLRDNMDRSRIPNPTKRDLERWAKYDKALAQLLAANPRRDDDGNATEETGGD